MQALEALRSHFTPGGSREGVTAPIVPSACLFQVFLQHRDAACSVGHVWGTVTLKAACSFSTAASAELWAEFLLSSHHCLCWER